MEVAQANPTLSHQEMAGLVREKLGVDVSNSHICFVLRSNGFLSLRERKAAELKKTVLEIAGEDLEDRSDKKIVELVKERIGRSVSRSHIALILRSNGIASFGTKVKDTGARRGRRSRPAEPTE